MTIFEKLKILADSAKYDVACTSSGVDRVGQPGDLGSAVSCGICHSFAADGRCISLLKVLMTNFCVYDCKYCVNRRSNDTPRAAFTPRELADLTIQFYRRNYIEGLFLSSGILRTPDDTCEKMIETLTILREEYRFQGYIHVKAIPGADSRLIARLGLLGDRMSVNIELPSQDSLKTLAPDKSKTDILKPMGYISGRIQENGADLVKYRHAPRFAPAGQSTQMIVGATPDSDFQILRLTEGLYRKYQLKRVFFSAYIPVVEDSLLPSVTTKPPLLREHRLYQADWLLRFYGFEAKELLDEEHQNFNPVLDPKCNWAVNHLELFPVEINRVSYDMLLRVPGIGVKSARKILKARKVGPLHFEDLKKLGVVLKRAQYFIVCCGKAAQGLRITQDSILRGLLSDKGMAMLPQSYEQLSLFPEQNRLTGEDVRKCLTGQM
ncbi:putative DNA modification/repair radical SAM protein [uncultured Ruminococcus sp.]|uniref:putative DNA modification/repair radical SAM protein n=1 Tax=Massiliimalia timonensis TaxID=1987501 RepID=UPI0008216C29|nr:putative DNA modification/repair radical SAM protein [Massiliimalia timonensis]SCH63454.1 putative DNA modification/repair radical SAM protein [uncultured Clostridium sp.]SCH78221.1 putative DNA modification/repair radical SAM protein [uncultured Ruminococcus sp.]